MSLSDEGHLAPLIDLMLLGVRLGNVSAYPDASTVNLAVIVRACLPPLPRIKCCLSKVPSTWTEVEPGID
jgi:hypothetical protein